MKSWWQRQCDEFREGVISIAFVIIILILGIELYILSFIPFPPGTLGP